MQTDDKLVISYLINAIRADNRSDKEMYLLEAEKILYPQVEGKAK